jgi:hypothetical protein
VFKPSPCGIHPPANSAVVGQTGASSMASVNPHSQILAVAIQLGLIGAAVLAAMWTAHFILFRGGGLNAWIGIIIVVDNVVASLVNSHLFDFTQGGSTFLAWALLAAWRCENGIARLLPPRAWPRLSPPTLLTLADE